LKVEVVDVWVDWIVLVICIGWLICGCMFVLGVWMMFGVDCFKFGLVMLVL